MIPDLLLAAILFATAAHLNFAKAANSNQRTIEGTEQSTPHGNMA
jgi:hypothetical protein